MEQLRDIKSNIELIQSVNERSDILKIKTYTKHIPAHGGFIIGVTAHTVMIVVFAVLTVTVLVPQVS